MMMAVRESGAVPSWAVPSRGVGGVLKEVQGAQYDRMERQLDVLARQFGVRLRGIHQVVTPALMPK